MNIIIVGAGAVGYSLAEHLGTGTHHITLIESHPELADVISSELDVYTVTGYAPSPAVLEKADIQNADMLIAVTPSDDANLLCCNFAKQCGVGKRIARIRSSDYTKNNSIISLEDLGVTNVIEPEKEIVGGIVQYIELPGFTESANFQFDNVYLRGYRITPEMPVAGKTLAEIMKLAAPKQLLIVLIIRGGKSIMPTGDETIRPGDEIVAIMPNESLETFRKLLNRYTSKLKKIIISGDTLTAVHLAKALEPLADRIILVDPDEQHGREAASVLNKTDVLHGDCTDVEMLHEVHIENTPFFVAAGGNVADNVMACFLAKAEGAGEVIAVTTNERHSGLFRSLGVDHIINPRKITAQKIIENVIRIPINTMLSIKNADVEVSRFVAAKDCPISDRPLQSVTGLRRKSLIIGTVFRHDTVIIPSGQTVIREGDEVLVLCPAKNLKLARRLFRGRSSPAP